MDDRLVSKLAQMAVRRELRERRLSLSEGLEILADLDEAGDTAEATRWRQFVLDAHARGDFRFTHELNRKEWAAVRLGREVPVWSLPEITRATQRFKLGDSATWARDAKPDRLRDAAYAEMKRAGREGRIMTGPRGEPVMFRSLADPLRVESAAELEAALDRKLETISNLMDLNAAIDVALERVNARLANGEAVLPTVTTLNSLEHVVDIVAATPSGAFGDSRNGRLRFTDVPRWNDLVATYNDVYSKAGGSRENRMAALMLRLNAAWDGDDARAKELAETVTGSPEPLPAELLTVECGVFRGASAR